MKKLCKKAWAKFKWNGFEYFSSIDRLCRDCEQEQKRINGRIWRTVGDTRSIHCHCNTRAAKNTMAQLVDK